MGAKKVPFYRIVVIDAHAARSGAPVATVGWYDPVKTDAPVKLDEEQILHWLSQGAQPTETVRSILKRTASWLNLPNPRNKRAKP